ncbi:MAG: hypothetical protein ACRDLP_08135 [Solirubrobacteraceae bacterium]
MSARIQVEHERLGARARRVAVVASIVALAIAFVSWLSAMSGPSNTALGVRTVEWMRDNGARGIVAQVEDWYYTLTAPSKGGHITALPKVGEQTTSASTTSATTPTVHHHAAAPPIQPARIAPMISPALPGEGVWRPTRSGLGSAPPLLVTTFRDETAYPQLVIGLAWIDTKRTRTELYTGRLEPAVTLPTRGPMEVPTDSRRRLLATFNSGFKLSDSLGGYAIHGHTYAPLRDGLATFVGYRDGRVKILSWTHGRTAPSSVLYARQNLPLIVDHGRLNPQISVGSEWGATVGNAILVWRSGVGIDRHGNLIYAAGNDQTAASLATALIRAGAVRAMELDINSYWVSFITYGQWGALSPSNLLPDMDRPATRYLTPDDRDFFAVYLRHRPA